MSSRKQETQAHLLELARRLAKPQPAPTRRQELVQRIKTWKARLESPSRCTIRYEDVCLLVAFQRNALPADCASESYDGTPPLYTL